MDHVADTQTDGSQRAPIAFWIPVEPRPNQRHRAGMLPKKGLQSMPDRALANLCRAHKCHTTRVWQGMSEPFKLWRASVQNVAAAAIRGTPRPYFSGSELEIWEAFYLRRPRTHFVAGKDWKGLKANAPAAHEGIRKTDNDNMEKGFWDALNGILFDDDSSIVDNHTFKRWAENEDQEGAAVLVAPLGSLSPAECWRELFRTVPRLQAPLFDA